MRLTEKRKAVFLKVLRKTGIVKRATAAASPRSKGGAGRTFHDARARDPEFAAAWDDALDAAIGDVEEALRNAATEGDVFERYDKEGNLISRQARKPDVRAIQLYLAARVPEYRQRHHVDVDAKAAVKAEPPAPDLSGLSDAELGELEALLVKAAATAGAD